MCGGGADVLVVVGVDVLVGFIVGVGVTVLVGVTVGVEVAEELPNANVPCLR